MNYVSTRGKSPELSFSDALQESLAPDGGLYVPKVFPQIDRRAFSPSETVAQIGAKLLAPYLEGDKLAAMLPEICAAAFNFPIPLRELKGGGYLLELFHGPTAAFKDVGARFLAECFSRIPSPQPRLVLVATSGDTGAAVAAAFHGKPDTKVVILFPKGRISPRQEKQLTAWGGNVRGFQVKGTFDDCQAMVKAAFQDASLRKKFRLVSANSISIGRLLPQQVYYAMASLQYFERTGAIPNFLIPTGNLGNAVAALWARRIGFPIGHVMFVTNANRAIPDYLARGIWQPQPTVATLANAMDVGNASNMERVFHLFPDGKGIKTQVQAFTASDTQIKEAIGIAKARWDIAVCPHTATAVYAREKTNIPHWVIVATAHAAKFDSIVEPIVGHPIPVPEKLAEILAKPSHSEELEPTLGALSAVL